MRNSITLPIVAALAVGFSVLESLRVTPEVDRSYLYSSSCNNLAELREVALGFEFLERSDVDWH